MALGFMCSDGWGMPVRGNWNVQEGQFEEEDIFTKGRKAL
jgi:hypothetical protein